MSEPRGRDFSMNWSCLDSADIRRLAAGNLITHEVLTLDKSKDEGGICSSFLGPRFNREKCGACNKAFCRVQHYAYIELPQPVILQHFEVHLRAALKKICLNCHQNQAEAECEKCCYPSQILFNEAPQGGQGKRQKIASDNTCSIDGTCYTAEKLWEILWSVRQWEEESAHPRCFMTDVVLVLPNSFRMWTRDSNNNYKANSSSQEISSNSYQEIFILARKARESSCLQDKEILLLKLYHAVNRMVYVRDTGSKSIFKKRGVLNAMVKKNKTGLLRHTMMGNTVFACGRGIVIGYSNMPVDRIGLPLAMCRELLFPEMVTSANVEWLRSLVRQKEALFVRDARDNKYIVTDALMAVVLRKVVPGATVERMLRDGDVAIINRQPTLHQGSMMCFYIIRVPGLAIRINPLVAAPFNADYDGDEMNVHVPISQQSRAEIIEIMHMKHRILGDSGRCQIGLVQNPLLGIWKLSGADISRSLYLDYTGEDTERLEVPGWWVLRYVFRRHRLQPLPGLVDSEGCICGGPLGSAHVGSGGSFIKQVWWEDNEAGVSLLNTLQRIGDHYIDNFGTSVGIGDLVHDNGHLLQEFEQLRTEHTLQYSQDSVIKKFEASRPSCGGFDQMNAAESKKANLRALTLFLGTQIVNGQAIPRYINNERILPTMRGDGEDPTEEGFVKSSLLRGLSPTESTLALLDGRCGIIKRSRNTAVAGKFNRLLSYRFAPYVVHYDGTVRDGNNVICQFLYGGDGIDPRYSGKVEGGRGLAEERTGILLKQWGVPDPDRYRVEPGTPMGLIAAHAMGQPMTQAILNSMHSEGKLSGQSKPRLEQLLAVSDDSPTVSVQTDTPEDARVLAAGLRAHSLVGWKLQEEEEPWEENWERVFGPWQTEGRKLKIVIGATDEDIPLRGEREVRFSYEGVVQTRIGEDEDPLEVVRELTEGFPVEVEGCTVRIRSSHSLKWFWQNLPHWVDPLKVTTDSMSDVQECFGLLGLREMMYREFLELNVLNHRHASFVIDSMLYLGQVSPNNPAGVQMANSNAFVSGTFQNPIGKYISAAGTRQRDGTRNVFYEVGFGEKLSVGTGFDFELREAEPEEAEPEEAEPEEDYVYQPSFD